MRSVEHSWASLVLEPYRLGQKGLAILSAGTHSWLLPNGMAIAESMQWTIPSETGLGLFVVRGRVLELEASVHHVVVARHLREATEPPEHQSQHGGHDGGAKKVPSMCPLEGMHRCTKSRALSASPGLG